MLTFSRDDIKQQFNHSYYQRGLDYFYDEYVLDAEYKKHPMVG